MLLYNTACPEHSSGMEIFSFQYIKGEVNIVVGIKMDALKSYFTFFFTSVNFVGATAAILKVFCVQTPLFS